MMRVIPMDSTLEELIILNVLFIGIPLTIWLAFKIHKTIEKIKGKKK